MADEPVADVVARVLRLRDHQGIEVVDAVTLAREVERLTEVAALRWESMGVLRAEVARLTEENRRLTVERDRHYRRATVLRALLAEGGRTDG